MRVSEHFPPIDFVEFHRSRVPDLIARNAPLAFGDVAGQAPLGFRVEDGVFTYVAEHGDIEVVEGDAEAETVAELTPDAFTDFAHELATSFALAIGERVVFPKGDLDLLVRWEPALRAIWHGRAIYDDGAAEALAGVDLGQSFAPADEVGIKDFIARTGFVHVRGVFSEHEMRAVADEVERLKAGAAFDDGRSWWAKNADGADVCCRLVYSGERSDLIKRVTGDDRIRRLVELTGADVRQRNDRLDGESVVIKNPDVVEGLSDLPWHRDCGMGGHPVICPAVNVGIQIDPATEDNGRLRFLAGTHESSTHYPNQRELERWPVQGVTTERGDVTMHFGHVLHEAPPPGGHHEGRRTSYSTWVNPLTFDVVEPGRGYNDSVLAKRGRVEL